MEEKQFLGHSVPTVIVEIDEIPTIHLYMDQVTTLIDEKLSAMKRYPEDKILTKTMINNYAKGKLFPPPAKKLYTRNHIMLLILIYHLKAVLSLADVEALLRPISKQLIDDPTSTVVTDLYTAFIAMQKGEPVPKDNALLCVLDLALIAGREKRLAERLIDHCFLS